MSVHLHGREGGAAGRGEEDGEDGAADGEACAEVHSRGHLLAKDELTTEEHTHKQSKAAPPSEQPHKADTRQVRHHMCVAWQRRCVCVCVPHKRREGKGVGRKWKGYTR